MSTYHTLEDCFDSNTFFHNYIYFQFYVVGHKHSQAKYGSKKWGSQFGHFGNCNFMELYHYKSYFVTTGLWYLRHNCVKNYTDSKIRVVGWIDGFCEEQFNGLFRHIQGWILFWPFHRESVKKKENSLRVYIIL